MTPQAQAIQGLKEAYNRLSAWSDNADLWASRMNDLDAVPYRNQAVNYRYCQERIETAIQTFTALATDNAELRQRFASELGQHHG